MKRIILRAAALCMALFTFAAAQAQDSALPKAVSDVQLLSLDGTPTNLPHFGEKHLLIFYVDPDHHKQNEAFTYELEENGRAHSDNIYAFGIMNLKDAPMVPNALARKLAAKRTAKNGALVLADQDRVLQTAWGLGKCNNLFVLLFVSNEGELLFMRKGELTDADKEAFYEVLDAYR